MVLKVKTVRSFFLNGDNAMGIDNDIVEAEVMEGVDDVFELVILEGGLIVIRGGQRLLEIRENHPPLKRRRLGVRNRARGACGCAS